LKEALIVWGGWEGHQPKQCAQVVTDLLKAEGLNVQVEDSASAFADPDLGRFDLIVPIVTQETISPEACKNLVATVTKGTGLAGFHGGMGDSFRAEPDYQFMAGGQWVAHPGNIISYRVMITKPRRPDHARGRGFRLSVRAVLHARRPGQRRARDDNVRR
jgi:uncharacterized protein